MSHFYDGAAAGEFDAVFEDERIVAVEDGIETMREGEFISERH